MPQWDNKAFDAHAGRLVDAWASTIGQGGASLTALVEKTARDHALAPEQVRRLCRVVNSKAFNARFEAMGKLGADRVVDFDVAKEDEVIGALHQTAAPKTAAAAATYPALRDEFAELRTPAADPFPKEAHERRVAERELVAAIPPDPPKTAQLLHQQRVASELRGRIAFESARVREAMSKLSAAARRVGFDVDDFEKNALAAHGVSALPAINVVRARVGREPLVLPAEKTAALLDRIVGRETPETRLVGAAIQAAAEEAAYKTAAATVDETIVRLRRELFGEA